MMPAMGAPFRGIIDARPYPPTGLTTERWKREVRLAPVRLADLTLTQQHLRVDGLFGDVNERSADDSVPHVVLWRGNLYLEDGHHRAVRAALAGAAMLMVRVFDAGAGRLEA
jgi:hypothetical protein